MRGVRIGGRGSGQGSAVLQAVPDALEEARLDLDVLPAGLGERLQRLAPFLVQVGRCGDLYVQVQVVTPDSLNEEQREALEAFAEAGGEDIEVEQGFFDRLRNTF